MLYSVVHRSLQLSDAYLRIYLWNYHAEIKILNTSLSKKDSCVKYFLLHFIFARIIFG